MPKLPMLIRGMWGLGDNIYSRPFIAAAAERFNLYLETPWPELYSDLDIKFVRGNRALRTQQKNISRQESSRWERDVPLTEFRVGYADLTSSRGIIHSMERRWCSLGVAFDPALFTLPDMGPAPFESPRPIAIVRPVTVRKEWRNEARNPLPEYVNRLAGELLSTHTVIAIADLLPGHEWLVGTLPPAHHYFVSGQWTVRQLLAVVRDADIVIGGVGWIVPAALALKTKTFVILGGHGGHNAPGKITDPRLESSHIGFAKPERFCLCTNMLHVCDKRMPDLLDQFYLWRNDLASAA